MSTARLGLLIHKCVGRQLARPTSQLVQSTIVSQHRRRSLQLNKIPVAYLTQSSSDGNNTETTADSETANDYLSPATANTFRSFVRTRQAAKFTSAAAAAATNSTASFSTDSNSTTPLAAALSQREWKDSPQLRALKEEARGGLIRRTVAHIQSGRMQEFLAWSESHLKDAYSHPGFKGSYLVVNQEQNTVENYTFWTSKLALEQNNRLPTYTTTMQGLGQFCTGPPEIELKEVALELPGNTAATAATSVTPSTAAPAATSSAKDSKIIGSEYTATVEWKRGTQNFLDNKYSRLHSWSLDGGLAIPASSAPSSVPVPQSALTAIDPEEGLTASVSSCHMLFFLAYARGSGFIIDHYLDHPVSMLGRDDRGKLSLTRVTLKPEVTFSGDKRPTIQEFEALHHKAHEACYIANSIRANVVVEGRIV